MSNPNPSQPSSGEFVPPGGSYSASGQPARQRPGCWLWGFLTCLTVALIFAAIFAVMGYKFVKSGIGRQIVGQAYQAQDCTKKMVQVHGAILRYHEHTGQYPPNLAALAPTYIDAAALHCEMDANPSPTHPTFAYKRPPAGTSENAAVPVISFHFDLKFSPDKNTNQDTDSESIMCLNGAMLQNQNQTYRNASGAVIYHTHTGSNVSLGPASSGK